MVKKNLSPNSLIIKISEMLNEKRFVSNYGGNLSVKTSANKILITPTCSSLVSITEDELVLTERNGDIIMGGVKPSRELFIHRAIYDCCEEIGGIIHTHSSLLSAYAQLNSTVKMITPEAKEYLKKIPIIKKGDDDYIVKELQKNVVNYNVILLEKHGVISCGKNLIDAYNNIELAEDAARLNLYIDQLKCYKKQKSPRKTLLKR